jgi:8-oxo-dGTP pyrophosphatase MutT (NUDIX family)
MSEIRPATPAAPGRHVAAALLVTPAGAYLMQLRDDKPTIFLPNHWALFGGHVEPGEDAAAALVRELFEELEFRPRGAAFFTTMEIVLPLDAPRRDRLDFFEVPVDEAEIAAMVQHEGAGKRLFAADELLREPRIAPWDLAAVLMHARRASLFHPRALRG